ncbi:hypothetical protein ACFQX6_10970 [Streptosporangium lutulentum]
MTLRSLLAKDWIVEVNTGTAATPVWTPSRVSPSSARRSTPRPRTTAISTATAGPPRSSPSAGGR